MKTYLVGAAMLGAVLLPLVLAGCRTRSQGAGTPVATAAAITIGADEASCPVLGTVMKKAEMTPVQYQGKTYYMCCNYCIGQFKANPGKYVSNPAAPTKEMRH